MGSLSSFDKISRPLLRKNLDVFVETGTGHGISLDYARKFPFKELFSIEIVEELVVKARKRFDFDSRITILHGESVAVLAELLPSISDRDIFFFLDAHWPGLDFKIQHEKKSDLEIALPLQKELDLIAKLGNGKSVIVIDDLRIYVDGRFKSGLLKKGDVPVFHESRMLDIRAFEATHNSYLSFDDDGYMLITPK